MELSKSEPILKIKEIAPLSFSLLGEEFFKKTLPLFFQELNGTDIFYFPHFFKKNQSNFKGFNYPDFTIELMDYEFTKFMIETDSTNVNCTLTQNEICLNPIAQAIRHEYDILEYVRTKKALSPKKTLLLLSKNSKTNEIIFLKGDIYHAAIIDELHDGKVTKQALFETLYSKYPKISESYWAQALSDLQKSSLVLS